MMADLVDEAVGHQRPCPKPKGWTGGEYDALSNQPTRRLRRLRGAGWLGVRGGVTIDVLWHTAQESGLVPGIDTIDTIDAFWSWYLRTAEAAVLEGQAHRNRARHDRLAEKPWWATRASYYNRRDRLARDAGYGTFWKYRKAMGWASNRPAPYVRRYPAIIDEAA